MPTTELVAEIRKSIEVLLSIKQNEKPVTLRSLDSHTMEGFGRGDPIDSVKSQSLLSNFHTDNKLNKDMMFVKVNPLHA